jgi:hypothetical protein
VAFRHSISVPIYLVSAQTNLRWFSPLSVFLNLGRYGRLVKNIAAYHIYTKWVIGAHRLHPFFMEGNLVLLIPIEFSSCEELLFCFKSQVVQ